MDNIYSKKEEKKGQILHKLERYIKSHIAPKPLHPFLSINPIQYEAGQKTHSIGV